MAIFTVGNLTDGTGTIKNKNMKYDNDRLITAITVIVVLVVIWLIISFIVMDIGWPIHTVIGRLAAVGIILGVIKSAHEE